MSTPASAPPQPPPAEPGARRKRPPALLTWGLGGLLALTLIAVLAKSLTKQGRPGDSGPGQKVKVSGTPIAGPLTPTPGGGVEPINAIPSTPDSKVVPAAGHHGIPSVSEGVPDPFAELNLAGDGPHPLGWNILSSFPYNRQETALEGDPKDAVSQIPESIRKIAGKHVTVTGFPLPVKMRGDTNFVDEMVVMRNPLQCCFGVAPGVNEWVHVRVAREASIECGLKPVSVTGILEVGEEYSEGWLTSIYRIQNAAPESGEPR